VEVTDILLSFIEKWGMKGGRRDVGNLGKPLRGCRRRRIYLRRKGIKKSQ